MRAGTQRRLWPPRQLSCAGRWADPGGRCEPQLDAPELCMSACCCRASCWCPPHPVTPLLVGQRALQTERPLQRDLDTLWRLDCTPMTGACSYWLPAASKAASHLEAPLCSPNGEATNLIKAGDFMTSTVALYSTCSWHRRRRHSLAQLIGAATVCAVQRRRRRRAVQPACAAAECQAVLWMLLVHVHGILGSCLYCGLTRRMPVARSPVSLAPSWRVA